MPNYDHLLLTPAQRAEKEFAARFAEAQSRVESRVKDVCDLEAQAAKLEARIDAAETLRDTYYRQSDNRYFESRKKVEMLQAEHRDLDREHTYALQLAERAANARDAIAAAGVVRDHEFDPEKFASDYMAGAKHYATVSDPTHTVAVTNSEHEAVINEALGA